MTSPLLVFTTDFGLADAYAGVIKGVALTINPELRLIDLTHQILPQNVAQGSFILGINHHFFPKETIHVAVVDPGVGTDRRPVLLCTPGGRFVAPDNGLLSGVISGYLSSEPTDAGAVKLPTELTALHLTNPLFWRHPVSKTFHGRDVFTPVAAHLSLGVAAAEMGEAIDSLFFQPMIQPIEKDGKINGRVIYRDVYGNLITNIPGQALPSSGLVRVHIKGRIIQGLNTSFNDPNVGTGDIEAGANLIALVGSHGYLEVAVPNGSAAAVLEADAGEAVEADTVSG